MPGIKLCNYCGQLAQHKYFNDYLCGPCWAAALIGVQVAADKLGA